MPTDTWFLVGMAARLALGLGLHSSPTYAGIPVDIAESRKRLFFSVYMMDRLVEDRLPPGTPNRVVSVC